MKDYGICGELGDEYGFDKSWPDRIFAESRYSFAISDGIQIIV